MRVASTFTLVLLITLSGCGGGGGGSPDTTPPAAVTVTSPSASPVITNGDALVISGTCETAATVNLTGDDTQNTACTSSEFSFTVTKTVDDTYNFALTQTDPANNTSTSVNVQWIRDTIPPTPPAVTAILNGDGTVSLSWGASTDDSGILEYRAQRGTLPLVRTVGLAATDDTVKPGSIVDYFVRAVDNAGNISALATRQSVAIPTTSISPGFGPPLEFQVSGAAVYASVFDVDRDGIRDLVVGINPTGPGQDNGVQTILSPLVAGAVVMASPNTPTFIGVPEHNQPLFTGVNVNGEPGPELLGGFTALRWDGLNQTWISIEPNTFFQDATLAYADLNGDAILDRVTSVRPNGFPLDRLAFHPGLGDGTFGSFLESPIEIPGTDGVVGVVVATDLDRDGLADLVVWAQDSLVVVRQPEPGTLVVASASTVQDSRFFRTALLVEDVTGDGYPDVIVTQYDGGSGELRVFINDGAGNFATTPVLSGSSDPWNFSVGDLDGDGIQDLIVGNRISQDLDLFISQGDGTFTLDSSFVHGYFPMLFVQDVDRDGAVDLVTVNNALNSGTVRVYLAQ